MKQNNGNVDTIFYLLSLLYFCDSHPLRLDVVFVLLNCNLFIPELKVIKYFRTEENSKKVLFASIRIEKNSFHLTNKYNNNTLLARS